MSIGSHLARGHLGTVRHPWVRPKLPHLNAHLGTFRLRGDFDNLLNKMVKLVTLCTWSLSMCSGVALRFADGFKGTWGEPCWYWELPPWDLYIIVRSWRWAWSIIARVGRKLSHIEPWYLEKTTLPGIWRCCRLGNCEAHYLKFDIGSGKDDVSMHTEKK